MTEIWYTPHDENRIEEIFEAMKHCQSLHPDPNGSSLLHSCKRMCFDLLSYFSSADFSEEEDEFIMAEDNNHEGGVGAAAAADGDDDIDQEEIRNLHIDGNFTSFNHLFCQFLL